MKEFNRYEEEDNDYSALGKKRVEIGLSPVQPIFWIFLFLLLFIYKQFFDI